MSNSKKLLINLIKGGCCSGFDDLDKVKEFDGWWSVNTHILFYMKITHFFGEAEERI